MTPIIGLAFVFAILNLACLIGNAIDWYHRREQGRELLTLREFLRIVCHLTYSFGKRDGEYYFDVHPMHEMPVPPSSPTVQ